MFKPLFVFVEGADDMRYIQRVIQPFVIKDYTAVIPIECAQKSSRAIKKLLQNALNNGHDYWILVDIDDKPCITTKKESVINRFCEVGIEPRNIIVVVKEIEAWYLAGLEDLFAKFRIHNTNAVTKEAFVKYASRANYQSSLELQLDILQNYNIERARSRNRSLDYYVGRLN